MAVADPRAEGGGGGHVLPVGRLEACLLLPLPLLVPLLHLALAHPAWGQKDGVITAHYGSYRQTERRRRGGRGMKRRDTRDHLTSDQRTSTDSPLVEHLLRAAFCFITHFDNLYNVSFHPGLMIGKRGVS